MGVSVADPQRQWLRLGLGLGLGLANPNPNQVSVADRQRQWRADGVSFERAYTRVQYDARSGPGGHVDTARVARLLQERPLL